MHTGVMPKIWNETITAHRDAVREATLDATALLVHEHGLTTVATTSRRPNWPRMPCMP